MAQRNVDNDDSKAEELLAQESMTETHSHVQVLPFTINIDE